MQWPMVQNNAGADMLGNVLNATTTGYSLIEDNETGRQQCGFWQQVEAAITNAGGKLRFASNPFSCYQRL